MKTRSIKELLANLYEKIENFEVYFPGHNFISLCLANATMRCNFLVTSKEYEKIQKYIATHKISNKHAFIYWWPVCDKAPRLNWIKQQLKSPKKLWWFEIRYKFHFL
jgi:hypothetical protein